MPQWRVKPIETLYKKFTADQRSLLRQYPIDPYEIGPPDHQYSNHMEAWKKSAWTGPLKKGLSRDTLFYSVYSEHELHLKLFDLNIESKPKNSHWLTWSPYTKGPRRKKILTTPSSIALPESCTPRVYGMKRSTPIIWKYFYKDHKETIIKDSALQTTSDCHGGPSPPSLKTINPPLFGLQKKKNCSPAVNQVSFMKGSHNYLLIRIFFKKGFFHCCASKNPPHVRHRVLKHWKGTSPYQISSKMRRILNEPSLISNIIWT